MGTESVHEKAERLVGFVDRNLIDFPHFSIYSVKGTIFPSHGNSHSSGNGSRLIFFSSFFHLWMERYLVKKIAVALPYLGMNFSGVCFGCQPRCWLNSFLYKSDQNMKVELQDKNARSQSQRACASALCKFHWNAWSLQRVEDWTQMHIICR